MNVTRTVGPTAVLRHEALFYGGKTSFLESDRAIHPRGDPRG